LEREWDGIFERELEWSRDEILERELDGMLRYDLIGRYLELEMEMRYGWRIEGKLSFVLFGMEIGSVMESSLGD